MLHSTQVFADPPSPSPPSLTAFNASPSSHSAPLDLSCTRTGRAASPSPPSLSDATAASPWRAASRRSADPYEACRCQLDDFVVLQEEQMELIEQLQRFLSVQSATAASAALGPSSRANAENIHPGSKQLQQQKSQQTCLSSSHDEHFRNGEVSPAGTPSSLVYRLHVMQHESAELASTRCTPALTHLLSSFAAYWSWKRTHMDKGEESTSGGGDAGGALSTSTPSGASSSLRQRYEHVVRIREEWESFLQLHREAVTALQPHLQAWARSTNSVGSTPTAQVPAASPKNIDVQRHARQSFALYVQELLEVAQTLRHVTCLLQTALAALCRPSPQQAASSRRSSSGVMSEHQGSAQVAHFDLVSYNGDTSAQGLQSGLSSQGPATAFAVDATRSDGRSCAAPSDSTKGHRGALRTQPLLSSPKKACNDEAWAGALSPLTPQPNASAAPTRAETVRGDAPSLSPSAFSSPPSPSPHPASPSQHHSNHPQRGRGSWERSLSTTAAVSLSPLTAVRHGDAAPAVEGDGRSRSRSSPYITQSSAQQHQQQQQQESPCDADVVSTAAVSPAVLAPAGVRTRGEKGSNNRRASGDSGGRSLLTELALAQGDEVSGEGSAGFSNSTSHQPSQQQERTPAQEEREDDDDAAAVVHVPLEELRSVSPREPDTHTRFMIDGDEPALRWSRSGGSETPVRSAGREESGEAGSVGRAASVPSVWWPRLSSAAPLATLHSGSEVRDDMDAARREDVAVADQRDVFYTAPSLTAAVAHHTSPTTSPPAGEGSAAPHRRASPSPPAAPSPGASLKDDGHAPPVAVAVEVEALEREADAIEAQLQRSTHRAAQTRRRRRHPPTRSLSSSSSSPSGSSMSTSPSRRHPSYASTHGRRRRRHSSERRFTHTLHRELAALRTEQRRSLQRMQQDMRDALDEVVSVATAAATERSSRASSSRRSQASGEEEVRPADASPAAVPHGVIRQPITASIPPPKHTTQADGSEELRASLAAAEARAARLEQQSIQLKKRLWLAEVSDRDAIAAPELDNDAVHWGKGKQPLSLRNAFVYGDLSTPQASAPHNTTRDVFEADAKGALVEEQALLYLVDRALVERRRQRGGALSRDDRLHPPHTSLNSAAAAAPPPVVNLPAPAPRNTDDSPSPMKCFDDGVGGVAQPSGRSTLIRQQRASIFERLRQHSTHLPTTVRADSKNGTTDRAEVGQPPSPPPLPTTASAAARSRGGAGDVVPVELHPPFTLSLRGASVGTNMPRGATATTTTTAHHPYSAPSGIPFRPASTVGGSASLSVKGIRKGSRDSPYYAAISHRGGDNDDTSPTSYTYMREKDKGGSTLRARQVLQNARRLLESRSGTVAGHASAHESGGASPFSPTADPPPSYATVATMAPPPTTSGSTPAVGAPTQHLSSQHCRALGDGMGPVHAMQDSAVGLYRDVGTFRSPSAGARPYGYDASPCAAVDYTSSKLPRPSPHGARETIVSSGGGGGGGGGLSAVRVDAATSPVAAPPSNLRRSRGTESVPERGSDDGWCHVPVSDARLLSRRAGPRSEPEAVEGPQHTTRGRSRRPSVSPHYTREHLTSEEDEEEDGYVPASVVARRQRSPSPAARSSSGNNNRDRRDAWHGKSMPQRTTVSRASSLSSSRGPAQADLLDTLTQQESLLHRALAQLHTQQQRLREKRQQVAQVAAATGLQATPPADTHRPAFTTPKSAGGQGRRQQSTSSPQSQQVAALLDRLTSAEAVLAGKVERVQQAAMSLQRQRAALMSDDFL